MTDTDGTLWKDDLLGYSGIAETFTHLIQSIDDTKVISIEAGFGQGKTFLRENWAKHLRQLGEVVIEIDAQQSDHSGEPVITFLGALLAAMPEQERTKLAEIGAKGVKLAGAVTRAVTRAILKNGAEELIETVSDLASSKVDGADLLKETISDLEEGMSRYAQQLIASQLAAETARTKELPEQIEALRNALTAGRDHKRVVVLIDELDRCHPDYAIAFLEAMKLVFNRAGFVFCLFVNADYLESLAQHRFGTKDAGERYLEKFVDIRLKLEPSKEDVKAATRALAMQLPLAIPFGEGPTFSVEHAATLAGEIAASSDLSFRQIKRVLGKVDLALRCYRERPIDCSLLILLAFEELVSLSEYWRPEWRNDWRSDRLKRSRLTPEEAKKLIAGTETDSIAQVNAAMKRCHQFLTTYCTDFDDLPADRLELLTSKDATAPGLRVLAGLGPRYIPEHQAMLNAVHRLMVP
ncbi:KAP family P-loop NTPase fold protein [Rhodobacter capsulatus]|uniref:KAP family P-loop NTPase fold protein n=1 Tax=Rhodobacter capsulatus TaxID=1061 RepID=UPI0003D33F6B|nr:P-loop NTPase fold protein [Rhodobacter capsulatus]ETD86889.1 hypothetical protein U716_02235 [Rhodobacter capsulatus B6]